MPGGPGGGQPVRRRRPQLTGRAAILAVVVCAIAMSLAYPVREYIAQRRQLAELQAEHARVLAEQRAIEEQRRRMLDPNYQRRTARERLHYCDPGAKCYMLLQPEENPQQTATSRKAPPPPWYVTLWESVEAADARETSGQ
ncbi:FtsB family cell division protein [Thermoactinospora rubra]|uniref:FtsB family cell division protein n=1 Tax=Thermoactinospora rubra TaxID=1088767 RepID=UPI000A10703C|nr:septum formation initiator family protein [Thermoactinospora rubra]